MNEFYAIFKRAKTELKTCAGSHGSSPQDPGQGTASKNSRSSSNTVGTKHRTNDTRGNPGKEEEGEDRSPKRPRPLSKCSSDKPLGLKFACPYHQHNPRKYGINDAFCDANYRTCAGPGWTSVARIK
jgi:hypothetical protein